MLTDKDRMELLNLRKRVESQREEIKRLTDEIGRLKEVVKRWAKAAETD